MDKIEVSPFEEKGKKDILKYRNATDPKIESAFYKILKRYLGSFPIELQRVENELDTGTPDLLFTCPNNSGYIELKRLTAVPKRRFKVKFQVGQLPWLRRHSRVRPEAVYLLIYIPDGRMMLVEGPSITETYGMIECELDEKIHILNLDPVGIRQLFFLLNRSEDERDKNKNTE